MTASTASPGVARPPAGRLLKILLAEDNAVNRVATQFLLRHLGHEADVAANGVEVLEALDREAYDVILMDVQMPVMDGLEATRRLRLHLPEGGSPRVIALTAGGANDERNVCLAHGMEDYLRKPIRAAELAEALARCPAPLA